MQSVMADKAVVEGIATAHGSVMQNANQIHYVHLKLPVPR